NARLDYGQVVKNNEVKKSCTITNTGKTPLIIRDVQPSINTITPSLMQTTIAPGASTTIDFTYKALGKIGKQGGNIEIITNDPTNDGVFVVKFEAEMLK
ncbi:MAG: DUF1573 domain-containing protein, partial [Bacteroidales bacterium]|nr:DUF1573 domain-containing protein [Bacteroidales bacterium]